MGKDTRRSKPEYQTKLARERMHALLERAVRVSASRSELARRYFQLAKKIGMRYNVSVPRAYRRKFCRKCFSLLREGWRFTRGTVHNTCKQCGHVSRYPYKPKRKG